MARLALLSTSDKTGLIEFAQTLVQEFGFEIISSGGTAQTLKNAGVSVIKVSDYTGFPEILGGRVKTLHPRIHGGILARRQVPEDLEALQSLEINPIDLVVVNLYPFAQTIAEPGVSLATAIEQIDIGGPTLIRAAAKNFQDVTVLCQSSQYNEYVQQLRQYLEKPCLRFRQTCAQKAFYHTALYDQAISSYLAGQSETVGQPADEMEMPDAFTLTGTQLQALRYGENPHQAAAWYQSGGVPTGWGTATQLQGKELSYNNLVDLEAARRLISEFTQEKPTAAILKHTNPCGVATADTLVDAYERAFNADGISAFGGIVALNQALDPATATALTKTFLECVVVPGCEPEAEAILKKKSKVRVLVLPDLTQGEFFTCKAIAGGFLVQVADDIPENPQNWQVVTKLAPTPEQMAEMLFAWKVSKHVKSNAIVVTQNQVTAGIGAGQMNRVGAVKIALEQAAEKAVGGVLASDGFFPFDDSVRTAAGAGITAIIQPGGSLRDQDSIDAANELGITMVMTGIRHFLH